MSQMNIKEAVFKISNAYRILVGKPDGRWK
jgi:hypothetical protein